MHSIDEQPRPGRTPRRGIHRFALVFAALSPLANAATLHLAPAADTTLYAENPGFASGAGAFSFIGSTAGGDARRTLWRFDLSTLPAGATINAVTVSFTVNRAALNASDAHVARLHRLTANWGEGTADGGSGGGGTQASPGDATWQDRYTGGGPAGLPRLAWNTPGGDFVAAPSALTPLQADVDRLVFASTAALVADVAGWVADPSSNFGWIVLGPEGAGADRTARRLVASESPALDDHPRLTIAFTPVPVPPALPMAIAGAGLMLLRLRRATRDGTRLPRRSPAASGTLSFSTTEA